LNSLIAQLPITAYACESNYITVSCPSPYRISVIRAVYGPPSEKMCNKCNDCGHCTFADVTSYFSGFNGQTSGSLFASLISYGSKDPCSGRTKATNLTYKCI
jgi:hypothetical protein